MYCLAPVTFKVCTSQTAVFTQAATSCGGYAFKTFLAVQEQTTCDASQAMVLLASEQNLIDSIFNLDIPTAQALMPSIVGLLAMAFIFKHLIRYFLGNSSG